MIRMLKHKGTVLAAIIGLLALIAGAVFDLGEVTTRELLVAQKPIGEARLISIEPLPAMPAEGGVTAEGEMCQWMPASASNSFAAALLQAGRASSESPATDFPGRKPVRMIRDRYPVFSGVALDSTNNEVVLADENTFSVLAYDRMTHTPPNAAFSEPKRRIGGVKTGGQYKCGVYVDPKNGDIYVLTSEGHTMSIFSRDVQGDVPPTRELEAPHGTFGIAVDEDAQEMFLTVQHDSAVVVFPKLAQGEDVPIRLLQGDRTRLADPHGIALDTKNHLIYVTNHGTTHSVDPEQIKKLPPRAMFIDGSLSKPNWPLSRNYSLPGSGRIFPSSITVYAKTAKGDTAPLRVIQGPMTQLNWPNGVAVDPESGELYVANDMDNSVLVFSDSANGDVAPIRVLKGLKSLVKNPVGVALDLKNKELWVSNFGNHTATVYRMTAQGDTPPLRVIRSAPLDTPSPLLSNPVPIAYDDKREQILVPN